jgi:hypothetical protein
VSAVRVEFGQVRVGLADRKIAAELAAHLALAPAIPASDRQRIWHGRTAGTHVTVACLGEPGASVTPEALERVLADVLRA